QGNAGVRRRRDGGADARDDLEWYAGGRERLGLLAAATEHERVAALEPDHAAAALGVHHEQRVDALLRQRMIAAGLAGKDAARAARRRRPPPAGRRHQAAPPRSAGALRAPARDWRRPWKRPR